jgi:hydrophobe/amphiphile efflux-1 (HAE1) family protein
MARFFIDRPVFAIVIAIVIIILGVVAIPNLPIAAFPEVVPPVVQITASYLGGNSIDLEKTVAQPIEEQLAGLDGMMYFLSSSANNGSITINVTFKLGTNPDTATVQTQNKVNIALPRLPPEVQRQGVVVKKVSSAFLMVVGLISPDNRYDSLFLTNYAQINLLNQIGSLPGVGDSRLSSQEVYSMRVWVDPDKMAKLGLTATDISDAVNAQNRQNPAGALGEAPAPNGTAFQYAVTAPGRLVNPEQFGDIVLRAQPDASLLRIRDVGRVELGSFTYSGFNRIKGKPSCNVIVFLSPGANAVDTSNQVNAFMKQAKLNFPPGVDYSVVYDSTRFVRASISDVVFTLMAAIGLVILVVFIFLQNWRATLIPLLTVPVAVIGAIALFPLLGFSINITSMFGLVLSIGIVVDDAIVVVEAVQRNIDDGMAPHEATIRAMDQVSAPVVAIACILAAVFIPVAFLGGISGQIYRQFALTIASSVLLSAFSALSLSPALSAMLLKPHAKSRGPLAFCFGKFNRGFQWATNRYLSGVGAMIRRSAWALVGLGLFWAAGAYLFKILPAGFLPDEDQAAYFVPIRLPDGASIDRTDAAVAKIEERLGKVKGVESWFVIGGTDFTTQTNASNVATIVVVTTPWDDRKTKDLQLDAILAGSQRAFADVPEAFTTEFGFPPILGLSNTGGFQFMLEDRRGGELDQLAAVGDSLVDAARRRPEIGNIVNTFRSAVPSYSIDMNLDKLETMGVPVTDAYNTLQTFLGGLYVNDFNRFSHTWQVLIQAEPEFRSQPSDIDRFYVRSTEGNMIPLGTLASVRPSTGPEVVFRYNRFRAIQILGSPAPGVSSGQAIDTMEKVAADTLPQGYGYEWTGTTYQQKLAQGHEGVIFGFATVLVFLCLAALYESWSIPMAVLLSLPLGLFGALLAVRLRDYPYDVYTQIGIVTLIGLAAKNAILIVEFAKESHHRDLMPVREAALHAAKLRLRPILMTSFAFILGVVPLFVATGAGAASRRSLGTAVFGGMLAATLLAIFFVPVQYYVIESFVERRGKRSRRALEHERETVEATD